LTHATEQKILPQQAEIFIADFYRYVFIPMQIDTQTQRKHIYELWPTQVTSPTRQQPAALHIGLPGPARLRWGH